MDTTTTSTPHTELDRARPAIVIHTALRRELRLAGPLVRRVPVGDGRRAETVARHLDVVLGMLHHHHENEDELCFPPVEARAGADELLVLVRMHEQHADVVGLLDQVEASLARWRTDAAATERDALAGTLERLHVTLTEHLDLEERAVLPLAERLLTEEEWEAIGRHGEQGAQGRTKLLVLGILVHEGDPAVIAEMLAAAPRPVRALLPRLARRTYRRHATVVHGTPTP
jgi:hypothetical protein